MSAADNLFSSVQLQVADGFWQRLVGLLGRKSLGANQGLLLLPCNNIHTAFMRFPIDAVFVSPSGVVIKIVRSIQPFRLAFDFKARACIELPSGDADRLGLAVGQTLNVPFCAAGATR